MPSAPRNSPDITKERYRYNKLYFLFFSLFLFKYFIPETCLGVNVRFSSDAVNGNSIRVTIPNVVESDDDDYYTLRYFDSYLMKFRARFGVTMQ